MVLYIVFVSISLTVLFATYTFRVNGSATVENSTGTLLSSIVDLGYALYQPTSFNVGTEQILNCCLLHTAKT